MSTLKIKFYSDPGHGWAAVKFKVLEQLGIQSEITEYSYHKGDTVYLEEDTDLSTLVKALKNSGVPYHFEASHTDRVSPIRSYPRYKWLEF